MAEKALRTVAHAKDYIVKARRGRVKVDALLFACRKPAIHGAKRRSIARPSEHTDGPCFLRHFFCQYRNECRHGRGNGGNGNLQGLLIGIIYAIADIGVGNEREGLIGHAWIDVGKALHIDRHGRKSLIGIEVPFIPLKRIDVLIGGGRGA